MVAAIDADRHRRAHGQGRQVGDARVPADVLVAGDGRRAAVQRGQQRHPRRVRSEDRRSSLEEDARHAAEGIAGARRRQALRRHRERQVLHPASTAKGVEVLDEDVIGSRGDPEPIIASPAIADGRIYVVIARIAEQPGLDRARLRDRSATENAVRRVRQVRRAAPGFSPASPPRLRPWRRFRSSRTKPCSIRAEAGVHAEAVRREGQLHSQRAGDGREVDARSAAGHGGARRHVRRRGDGRIGGIREGDGRRGHRPGARARDSAAAVDVRLQRRQGAACRGGRPI